MLGWMLIFALLSLTAVAAAFSGGDAFNPGMTATLVFGFLLLISLLTRTLRGKA